MPANTKEKVAAVVVTYNRKDLLKECINSLKNQTLKLDKIFIIDNASTDGTEAILKKNFLNSPSLEYVKLPSNLGGSWGFYKGLKTAYEAGYDWFWCMDDDILADEAAYEELWNAKCGLESNGEKIGFLASNVLWTDGNPCKMNVPVVARNLFWNKYLEDSIVQLRIASFAGLMVSREAVKSFGLPLKEFFIWGDDYEYTLRISNNLRSYLVGKCKVVHKTKENFFADYRDIQTENLWKFKCDMRNRVFNARKTSDFIYKTAYFLIILHKLILTLFSKSNRFFLAIIGAFIKGIFFSPEIEFPKEKPDSDC